MERIVIEVDDNLAKAWQRASDTTKKSVGNKINQAIAKELVASPTEEYLSFLKSTRTEMKEKGLTEEGLDNILSNG
jgi:hypothetical protein